MFAETTYLENMWVCDDERGTHGGEHGDLS